MVGRENSLVARLREHIPHLVSSHCIAHREALAVKDAASACPDLDMVDKVIRSLADLLGRSSVWSQRFKYLQRVIHKTNLEVQGIHAIRWLSRGEAVRRLWGAKRVKVRGVDKDGQPVTHTYQMHERQIKGHVYQSNYRDCELLCAKFAKGSVTNLLERLDDLSKLGPTKLFRAGKWPRHRMVREKKTREYLHGCSAIFDDKLPGFDLEEAEKELATWAPIMQNHHNEEGFYQGLTNYLGNTESSRQNVIKSWVRGALCNARLGELMMISLLRYDINWQEALELWHAKKRRPAKSVVFASQERKRKGKALLEEAEQEPPVQGLR
ncbi:hypothetical protein CLOP_g22248 [Closterium sp. NIES-67]|nr:hypothetical protein CLOP_g22248 [Closterium sp. NIES-67]